MSELDINKLILMRRSEAVVAAGLGEVRNGILYLGSNAATALEIYQAQPPVQIPVQPEAYGGDADVTVAPVIQDSRWETAGEAMRVVPIDYKVAEVLAKGVKDTEIYSGIGVGSRKIEGAETIPVIDESGQEIDIKPEDFWQFEHDALQNAIMIDEWEATEGDRLYGTN